ncbi:hypothetical protein ACF07B_07930 [Streptomyces sp. NPDC015532]|uniref:hypothetical protein n=1 Tax=Streptomyces sp. NPDC015532 TaxID=3364960 RepID=UPI0037011749
MAPQGVDGDTVRPGAWFAKARAKHRDGRLPEAHARLVAVLFDDDWTTEGAVPAAGGVGACPP